MAAWLVIMRARVRMLSADEGGRSGSILAGYRPRVLLDVAPSDDTLATIDRVEPAEVLPGQTCEMVIRMVRYNDISAFKSELQVGRSFSLREGLRIVAVGQIVSIISTEDID